MRRPRPATRGAGRCERAAPARPAAATTCHFPSDRPRRRAGVPAPVRRARPRAVRVRRRARRPGGRTSTAPDTADVLPSGRSTVRRGGARASTSSTTSSSTEAWARWAIALAPIDDTAASSQPFARGALRPDRAFPRATPGNPFDIATIAADRTLIDTVGGDHAGQLVARHRSDLIVAAPVGSRRPSAVTAGPPADGSITSTTNNAS